MKVAVVLALSLAVLAVVKAQDEHANMKAPKLPQDMLDEEAAELLHQAREDLDAVPDQMQRRGGKGGDAPPPPPPMGWGWGPPPMMGWGGPPPMMGWGGPGPAMGPYGR